MSDTVERTRTVRETRPGHHPVRRRLRRRHAAHGRPVHERQRPVRQRPGDAARVPGRDPGAGRHARRRLRVPDPHLRPRHHDARRRPQRAGGDEPGRAEARAAPAGAGRHADRQRRHLRGAQPHQGRATPTTRSTDGQPRGLHGLRGPDDRSSRRRPSSPLGREAPRRRPVEELLRPRPRVVDVHPARRADARVDRGAVRASPLVVATPTPPRSRPGYAFGETAELFDHPYQVQPGRSWRPGTYTNITGNTALAWGLVAAGQLAKLPLFLGSYPITPASDILHELSKHKNFGVRTLQAEDEIAGIGAALGAAFGGHLGVTTTSGPGMALKAETMGLAVSLELPLLIIDIQRGGPSTGLPTKTEAADLLHGHVRPPRRVAAADRRRREPGALLRRRHRGGPHRPEVPHAGDPAVRRLPRQRLRAVAAARRRRPARHLGRPSPPSPTTSTPTASRCSGRTSATPTRSPGRGRCRARPASMHRIGGIEKEDGSGNISYDPDNHERMVRLRAAKIAGIADDIPPRRGRRRRRRRRAPRPRLGLDVGRHRRRHATACGPGAARSPTPTSPTSTRSRANLGECCAATRRCSCPR